MRCRSQQLVAVSCFTCLPPSLGFVSCPLDEAGLPPQSPQRDFSAHIQFTAAATAEGNNGAGETMATTGTAATWRWRKEGGKKERAIFIVVASESESGM